MKLKSLIRIIPASFGKKGAAIALAIPLKALLNFLGLAALLPLLLLVLSNGVAGSPLLSKIYAFFRFTRVETFALALCLAVFVILLIKNKVLLDLSVRENRFLLQLYGHYSSKLFDHYYGKGLLFLNSQNTSSLIHDINYLCYQFAIGVLSPLFTLSGEMLFLLFVYIALLVYRWKVALLLPLCYLPVIVFYMLFVKKKLKKYGEEENNLRRNQSRILFEAFKGYTSLEINQAFPWIRERFVKGIESLCGIREKTGRIAFLPSALGETAIALGLIFLLAFFPPSESMRLMFGVFALATLRILPSINKILGGWTKLKNGQHSFEVIQKALQEAGAPPAEPESTSPLTFEDSIRIEHLSFSFEGRGQPLLNDLSLTIHKGEKLGIKGPSGIGKTSLFNLLLGFYPPGSGDIFIDGVKLHAGNRKAWQKHVGYVPQEVFIAHASLAQNIALGYEQIDRDRVLTAVKQAHLDKLLETLPYGIDTSLGDSGCRLSGGEKQRVGIARALYKGASVLFFDEATSSLDYAAEHDINKTIEMLSAKDKSLTLIIISHRESSLHFCDRIIEL